MPIEIRELNIKAYIDESAAPAMSAAQAGLADNNVAEATEKIIAACVEQVLQILKDKEER